VAALQKKNSKKLGLKVFFLFLLLLIVPLAWRWTPLNEWVNFETIIEWQQSVKDYPTAFYLVVGAYLLGSLFLFPVTVLNVATVLTFVRSRATFTRYPDGSPVRPWVTASGGE
jgi:hypothetical protein